MISYFKYYFLITVLILCSCGNDVNPKSETKVIHVIDKGYLIDSLYKISYDELVKYIKLHEGYSARLYYCPAGYPTIGYGHLINGNEYNNDSYLTESEAERLLIEDFNKAIKLAIDSNPELNKLQHLAIGHFIYGRGIGNYTRSKLKELINSSTECNKIKIEFGKHSYYRDSKTGKLIFSSNANKMRMTEFEIYKRGRSIEESYRRISKLNNTEIIYYKIENGLKKLI